LVLGLVIGSFSNVCIYRIPRGESVISPGSHCPRCGATLKPYDNIPLLSYLLLRGRCRQCKERISPRYPLVEFLNGLSYVLIYSLYGLTSQTLVYFLLSSALLIIAFIDLEEQIVPDVISLPGIVVGLVLSFFVPYLSLVDSALGVVVAGGIILLIGVIGSAFFKQEAMGGGDVKLAAMLGAFLGWRYALLALFLGFISGAVVGMVLILAKVKGKEDMLPFGPFLVLGFFITLFWGEKIISAYLGF